MEFKKLIKHHGPVAAGACAVLAFILFIPACITKIAPVRVALVVAVGLLLVLGGAVLFLWNREREARVHYFLYDRRRDKNRQTAALTPDDVMDAMDYYIAPFARNAVDMLEEIPKQLRLQLEGEGQFKPLVAFRMLSALAEADEDQILTDFSASDLRAITYVCRALEDAGEGEMADFIYHLRKNAEGELSRIPNFFKRNAKWFGARAVRYVNRNFEKFYVEKSRFVR